MRERASLTLALVVLLASALWSAGRGRQPAGAGQQRPPVQLPEGPGREQVQTACGGCHGLDLITSSSGYTKEGWQDRISTMVTLPPELLNPISTLPSPDARPRRLAITADDVIWYADFARGYLGRFDPKTGMVKEWLSPSGKESEPYGIAAIGNVVWYSESGTRPNTLVRFDAQTEEFQTWAIPSSGGVIRNMMATRDGNLVLACSAVNRVGLVEVGTGPEGSARR